VKVTYTASKTAAVKATASTDSNSRLRQAALSVVNKFRAKAGVKAVKMSSKYNAILDKRATAKAKQYVTTGTYDHSGYSSLPTYLNTYPIVNGKIIYHGGETLHACYYNAQNTDTTTEMASCITSTFTENMQAEKDDYEAIVVKKTRKNITNISGTYEHYTMMVDSGNHTVYIGVGHYGSGNNAMVCVVIEYHA
ncbi:CAP domain-containing protein, partial [Lactobacillus nasalidis]